MKYVLTLLVCIFTSGQLLAKDVSPSDFAAGYYLEVDNNGAVYSLELPADVYRTVRNADLGDVRVFNSAGEPVPHGFRTVEPDSKTLRRKESVPFFPLFQVEQRDNQTDLLFRVTRDRAGTILNIDSRPAAESVGQEVTGYLLDLSTLKQGADHLELQWQKNTDSSVFTINIQQSSDLVRWMPLMHKATLADLHYAGQRVERRTMPLPGKSLKYLKLTWNQTAQPLLLTEITSFSQVIESRQKRLWVPLYNGQVLEQEDRLVIDYESNYRLPANSAQVRFAETNSIANLSVQSRSDKDGKWRTRCEQVFYNLNLEGAPLQSEPCTFQPTGDAMWRLVVKQDGAGLRSGNKALTLQLGWTPQELLFVGRGNPPFLLAFGSGRSDQHLKVVDSGMILQTTQTESPRQVIRKARLGKRIKLGGEAVLQPPPARLPWKKWLLWAVLLLGVGLLALMARSLIKEMKIAEEKNVSKER